MPATGNVDERIVEMRIDHEKFEQGAKKTIDILERLDEGLKALGTKQSDGFDDITNSLDKVTNKISVFGTIGDQIIRNLTTKAMELASQFKHMVDSLSLDQVSAGWSKYAEKTQGVQTIMAATAKDWKDQGAQMDYVSAQLDKLNWFTDETSYNLLDMVNNIGKFTSNGVKLETAVTAMQGIATWAGISGANTQEASRAMYNFSQALGVGAVTQMDWKSIENANMATYEFKQIVLETAAEMGKLKKISDSVYRTDYSGKKGEVHDVTVESFRQYLSDKWFDSDVLMAALEQYGGFTDLLYEVYEATGLTATEVLNEIEAYEKDGEVISELLPYIKDLTSAEFDLGRRAFRAAQEAKTFQEAIDATKDAVSTAWMNVFETTFGNYLQAKELWTDVAESLYTIFAEPVYRLYDIFNAAFHNPNPLKDELTEAGYTMTDLEEAAKSFYSEVVDGRVWMDEFWRPKTLEDLINDYGSLEEAIKAGAVSGELFLKILDQIKTNKINEIVNGQNEMFNGSLDAIQKAAERYYEGSVSDEELKAQGYDMRMVSWWADRIEKNHKFWEKAQKTGKIDMSDPAYSLAGFTTEFYNTFYDDLLKLAGYTDEEIAKFKELGTTYEEVMAKMTDPEVTKGEGFKLFGDSLLNLLTVVENVGNAISAAFTAIFGGKGKNGEEMANSAASQGIYNLISRFYDFTQSLVDATSNVESLKEKFVGLGSTLSIIGSIFSLIKGALKTVLRFILSIFSAAQESGLLQAILSGILIVLQAMLLPIELIIAGIGKLINKGKNLKKQEWVKILNEQFSKLAEKISNASTRFREFMASSKVTAWLTKAVNKILSVITKIYNWFVNIIHKIREFGSVLRAEFDVNGLVGVFQLIGSTIRERFTQVFDDLKARFDAEGIKGVFKGIIANIAAFFSSNSTVKQIGDSIDKFFANIFTKFGEFLFGKGNAAKLTEVWDSIKQFFTDLFEGISGFLSKHFNIQNLKETLSSIGNAFSEGFNSFKTKTAGKINLNFLENLIVGFFEMLTRILDSAMPLLKFGAFVLIGYQVFKFVRAVRWAIEGVWEFTSGMKFLGLGSFISSLALATVGFTVAVKLLAGMTTREIAKGLAALQGVVSIILGFITVFTLINKIPGGMSAPKMWAFLPLAIGLGIVVAALVFLGKMDIVQMFQGFIALTALLTEILAFLLIYGVEARLAGPGIRNFIFIGAGIFLIVKSLQGLASMKVGELLKGFIGLRLIFDNIIRFLLFAWLMPKKSLAGLLFMALSVVILAKALKGLGSMKVGAILKGWLGLSLIMGQIIKFVRKSSGYMLTAGKSLYGLIGVALAVVILAGAFKILGTMSIAEIFKSSIAVFVLIGQLIRVMRKSIINSGSFLTGKMSINMSSFWGLIGLAIAVAGLAAVMVLLGKTPRDQLERGFTALAGIMLSMTMVMRAAGQGFKNKAIRSIFAAIGVVMIIAAAAFALKKLSEIPAEQLYPAAVALSGTLIAIAGAMALINRFSGEMNWGIIPLLGTGLLALIFVGNILKGFAGGGTDWKTAGIAALVCVGTIVTIGLSMLLLNKLKQTKFNWGLIPLLGVGIGALWAVGKVLTNLGAFNGDWKTVGAGAIVCAETILAIGLAMIALNKIKRPKFNVRILALLAVSIAALFAVGRVLIHLGKFNADWKQIGLIAAVCLAVIDACLGIVVAIAYLGYKMGSLPSGSFGTIAKGIAEIGLIVAEIEVFLTLITGIGAVLVAAGIVLAEQLCKFADKIKPFIDTVKTFDNSAVAGVGRFVEIMGLLTIGEIFTALATVFSWMPNGALFDDLDNLGQKVVKFASDISSLKPEDIDNIRNFNDVMGAIAGITAFEALGEFFAWVASWFDEEKEIETIDFEDGTTVTVVEKVSRLFERINALALAVTGEDGFLANLKEIDPKNIEKVQTFAAVMQAIAGVEGWAVVAEFLNAIGNVTDKLGNKLGVGGSFTENFIALYDSVRHVVDGLRGELDENDDGEKDKQIGTKALAKIKNFALIMQELAKITGWLTISKMLTAIGNRTDISVLVLKKNLENLVIVARDFSNTIDKYDIDGADTAKIENFADIMNAIGKITVWHNIGRMMQYLGDNLGSDYMPALMALPQNMSKFAAEVTKYDYPPTDQLTPFVNFMKEITRITGWAVLADMISALSPYAGDGSKADAVKSAMLGLLSLPAMLINAFKKDDTGDAGAVEGELENEDDKINSAIDYLTIWSARIPEFLENIKGLNATAVQHVENFVSIIQALNKLGVGTTLTQAGVDVAVSTLGFLQKLILPLEGDDTISAIDSLIELSAKMPDLAANVKGLDADAVSGVDAFVEIIKSLTKLGALTSLVDSGTGVLTDTVDAIGYLTGATWIADGGQMIKDGIGAIVSFLPKDDGTEVDEDGGIFGSMGTALSAFYNSIIEAGVDIPKCSEIMSATAELINTVLTLRETLKEDKNFNSAELGSSLVFIIMGALNTVASDGSINDRANYIGRQIVAGIATGIYMSANMAISAATWLANVTASAAAGALEVESPSKVFARIGEYLPAGLAKGVKDNIGVAEDSMTIMGSAVLAAMEMAMAQVATVADEDFEFRPTITPVVDMSNVQYAAGTTRGMFGSIGTAMHGSMKLAMDTMTASSTNATRDNGSGNIVSELQMMSGKLDALGEAVSNMQIVLDTGTLVGSTSKKMNAALGTEQMRKNRAN